MYKLITTLFLLFVFTDFSAQSHVKKEISKFQKGRFNNGICLDFIRDHDLPGIEDSIIEQIIIIRHGEPAMNKKGWKNRKEAIRYTEMYDSVGVYDFEEKPICLRENDLSVVYTSNLPRAINTAEKTFDGEMRLEPMGLFNEFERKVIKFPNIKLPRQFWSVTTRIVWMMGFNKKGIESFSDAKHRSERAAQFLDNNAGGSGKTVLFAHGFLNKYVKRYLKKSGFKVVNLDGQEYLGAYYFYKII